MLDEILLQLSVSPGLAGMGLDTEAAAGHQEAGGKGHRMGSRLHGGCRP